MSLKLENFDWNCAIFYKINKFSIKIMNFRHKYRMFIKINGFSTKLINLQENHNIFFLNLWVFNENYTFQT